MFRRCQDDAFRWDLYYGLAVADLELPPIRSWNADEVEALLDFLLEQKWRAFRRKRCLTVSPEVRRTLLSYGLPGNVRELAHLVERLYVFSEDEASLADLPERVKKPTPSASLRPDDVERAHVLSVYRRFGGNKQRTAQALGCVVNTLKNKLRKYEEEGDVTT